MEVGQRPAGRAEFGRQGGGADGVHDRAAEGLAYWNGLWRYAGFRRTQYLLTGVWGGAFLLEAAARVELTYLLPTDQMVLANSVLPLVVVGALVAWTVLMAKRGRARSAAASAGDA
ncbi:hypothetical protein [Actinomadura hibisca]|uniref:hypothetical protein n=1 Tax=Actinomadura hibisca TaxID=68565 RepID=UPI00082DBA30|nr:hypothetical protein [Actinomadura hibisca]